MYTSLLKLARTKTIASIILIAFDHYMFCIQPGLGGGKFKVGLLNVCDSLCYHGYPPVDFSKGVHSLFFYFSVQKSPSNFFRQSVHIFYHLDNYNEYCAFFSIYLISEFKNAGIYLKNYLPHQLKSKKKIKKKKIFLLRGLRIIEST